MNFDETLAESLNLKTFNSVSNRALGTQIRLFQRNLALSSYHSLHTKLIKGQEYKAAGLLNEVIQEMRKRLN
ncbi:hypothetical protein ACFQZX_14700 [Mucilaginibacter litoreus]|uniref:Uncharacterized protein n=1 Tax=Mucilaginibacter litoreus TaxID=1048221 RepID=A0ABW3AVB3_9SPHI